jgi:hypothetical protein
MRHISIFRSTSIIFLSFVLLSTLMITSCSSPARLIKHQKYDQAIEKLSKKMRSGKTNDKEIAWLKQAYHTANQLDHDRIMMLKKSGQPDVWSEIYASYEAMYQRQQLIRSIPVSFQQRIDFKVLPLEEEMAAAKSGAQAYLYASAVKLLETKNRSDARKAYDQLIQLSKYGSYRDMDQLLRKALLQGTNQVLILFSNDSRLPLPDDFESRLMSFNLDEEDFVQYDFQEVDAKQYDYTIYVRLKEIISSPEKIETRSFTEKSNIESGTKPLRDEQGHIVLDSLGKVIEVPDYKTIEALVHETVMGKSLTVNGQVEYVNMLTNRRELTTPITSTMHFRHAYAVVHGDLRAISEETRKMMGNRAVPFPPDWMMLRDAVDPLKEAVRSTIRRERSLVRKAD